MLAAEPRDAIAVVFEALGATNRAGDRARRRGGVGARREPRPDLAVLFPQFGAWAPPGGIADGHAHAVGLATARVTTARELLVVVQRPDPKLAR